MSKSEEPKKESRIKTKKKAWYKILSPPSLGSKEIGESYLASAESSSGRTMRANLRDLTGNPKDQNIYLRFRIGKAEGLALPTSLIGYELAYSTIKRMVRPGVDRLDDQMVVQTKDRQRVIVKMIGVTLHKTNHSVHSRIRHQWRQFLKEEMKKGDIDAFVLQLIESKLRAALKKKLDKIYPLRELAVKSLLLAGKDGRVQEEPVPETVSEEQPSRTAEAVEAAVTAEPTESLLEREELPVEQAA